MKKSSGLFQILVHLDQNIFLNTTKNTKYVVMVRRMDFDKSQKSLPICWRKFHLSRAILENPFKTYFSPFFGQISGKECLSFKKYTRISLVINKKKAYFP